MQLWHGPEAHVPQSGSQSQRPCLKFALQEQRTVCCGQPKLLSSVLWQISSPKQTLLQMERLNACLAGCHHQPLCTLRTDID